MVENSRVKIDFVVVSPTPTTSLRLACLFRPGRTVIFNQDAYGGVMLGAVVEFVVKKTAMDVVVVKGVLILRRVGTSALLGHISG